MTKKPIYFMNRGTAYKLDPKHHPLVYKFIANNQDTWISWYNRYVNNIRKKNINEKGEETHVLFPYYIFNDTDIDKICKELGVKEKHIIFYYGGTNHRVLEFITTEEKERRDNIYKKYGLIAY